MIFDREFGCIQVEFEKGLEMLNIFNKYVSTSSLLLDGVSTSQQQSPPPSPNQDQQEQGEDVDSHNQMQLQENQATQQALYVDTNHARIITDETTQINMDTTCDCIDQTTQETPAISSVDTTCGCIDETHLETCMQPPKTTVDIEETTKVIVDNTGDTKQIP